jgi:hypothetical protein
MSGIHATHLQGAEAIRRKIIAGYAASVPAFCCGAE